ncbi:IS66 family transposase [Sulfidibacter corallicola]|uniref:IS66 family transposase n=2 Tax=Sulfidibacter corallicola TaxID=2818388 RepID=A0A8A4TRU2_SULCO|nr:IS66 family transposase [Sulfidibacter corallicola]QTD51731.1 IS66 family transposase [Sulfidibacter corallicola]
METVAIALAEQNEALKQALARKDAQIATLDQHIGLLEEQLRLLKAKAFGPKSERMSQLVGQQALFDMDALEAEEKPADDEPASDEDARETITYERRKTRGPQPFPEHLPREIRKHELPPEERQCTCCGEEMTVLGKDVTRELEYEPAVARVIEHHHYSYSCQLCKQDEDGLETPIVSAPRPPRLIPGGPAYRGMAGPGLLAFVMTSKFVDGLPFYRVERLMGRLGVKLGRATMCNWARQIGDQLERMWDLLLAQAKQYTWLQMDETTVQVLNEPDKENTTKSFMWVIRGGPPERPIVLFHYDPSRSGTVAARLLEDFQGTVQTDGYAGYDFLGRVPGVVHAGDWDHVRRKFADVRKPLGRKGRSGKSGKADEALKLIGEMYQLERKARGQADSDSALLEMRDKQLRPKIAAFKTWLDHLAGRVPPKSLLGRAIQYALGQWHKLDLFLDRAEVPMSTALVENAIRPYVIGRKAWLFSGSPEDAQASARIYSIVETALYRMRHSAVSTKL